VDKRIRVEIAGKDEFWSRAFHVEWEHQFPERKLIADGAGHYEAEPEWLDDLERVAAQTFCRITRAPDNPQRREWLSSIIPRRGGR
jgi:hypothetical protein